jgi:tetratricopeptide (TPR) repeat protein
MGLPALFLLAAATTQTVSQDQVSLRKGCEAGDQAVASVPAGSPVEVRFSLAGSAVPCFAVTVTVDGKKLNGYLPGAALSGAADFEKERQGARSVEIPSSLNRAVESRGMNVKASGANPVLLEAVRLLESQQPGQALTRIEEILKQRPNDAELLALAGIAAYRSDDLRRAKGYFQDSLAIRPDAEIDRLLKRVEKESAADKTGQQLYGTRFVLRYDGTVVEPEIARTIVQVLEEEYTRVSFELGCQAQERISTIVQSREAYMRATDAAEWSGGLFDGSRIRVPIATSRTLDPDARRTFAHEIVHACLASTGNWPAWLHEGLAQRLSGRTLPPQVRAQFQSMARAGALPKLNRLGQSWSRMSTMHAQVAYGLALAAVDAFYEHYREFGIRNLIRNPDMLPRIADELDQRLRQ